MLRTRHLLLGCAAALALATAACASSSSSSSAASGGKSINATEHDFEIALDQSTVASGDITFTVTNNGPSTHEFVVVKTDDAPDDLPVENGVVPEDGLDVVGEQEEVAPSTTATLSLTLPAGQYVIMCNITGHYEAGMRTGLTVS